MEHEVQTMTFKELKDVVSKLEKNQHVNDKTKLFIDTGWDSVQEIDSEAVSVETVMAFTIEDELTKEQFKGYSLIEKAEKMGADGEEETVIIIRNLY
ncbi:hypothetical protein IW492_10390 [Enterococcus sp. BWB1-3]|uniref:hypothetical protein n=1 Tax=Enterococcus sp. BWB1-3 TaxID=2787713 RepID=UPI001923CA40|nr:hypothetical protein [Enterococcus sp. BWB1-3]MBL1229639.1 hypothetical protein [Enterococcus sp. BWB1-3]